MDHRANHNSPIHKSPLTSPVNAGILSPLIRSNHLQSQSTFFNTNKLSKLSKDNKLDNKLDNKIDKTPRRGSLDSNKTDRKSSKENGNPIEIQNDKSENDILNFTNKTNYDEIFKELLSNNIQGSSKILSSPKDSIEPTMQAIDNYLSDCFKSLETTIKTIDMAVNKYYLQNVDSQNNSSIVQAINEKRIAEASVKQNLAFNNSLAIASNQIKKQIVGYISDVLEQRFNNDKYYLQSKVASMQKQIDNVREASHLFRISYDMNNRNRMNESNRLIALEYEDKLKKEKGPLMDQISNLQNEIMRLQLQLNSNNQEKDQLQREIMSNRLEIRDLSRKLTQLSPRKGRRGLRPKSTSPPSPSLSPTNQLSQFQGAPHPFFTTNTMDNYSGNRTRIVTINKTLSEGIYMPSPKSHPKSPLSLVQPNDSYHFPSSLEQSNVVPSPKLNSQLTESFSNDKYVNGAPSDVPCSNCLENEIINEKLRNELNKAIDMIDELNKDNKHLSTTIDDILLNFTLHPLSPQDKLKKETSLSRVAQNKVKKNLLANNAAQNSDNKISSKSNSPSNIRKTDFKIDETVSNSKDEIVDVKLNSISEVKISNAVETTVDDINTNGLEDNIKNNILNAIDNTIHPDLETNLLDYTVGKQRDAIDSIIDKFIDSKIFIFNENHSNEISHNNDDVDVVHKKEENYYINNNDSDDNKVAIDEIINVIESIQSSNNSDKESSQIEKSNSRLTKKVGFTLDETNDNSTDSHEVGNLEKQISKKININSDNQVNDNRKLIANSADETVTSYDMNNSPHSPVESTSNRKDKIRLANERLLNSRNIAIRPVSPKSTETLSTVLNIAQNQANDQIDRKRNVEIDKRIELEKMKYLHSRIDSRLHSNIDSQEDNAFDGKIDGQDENNFSFQIDSIMSNAEKIVRDANTMNDQYMQSYIWDLYKVVLKSVEYQREIHTQLLSANYQVYKLDTHIKELDSFIDKQKQLNSLQLAERGILLVALSEEITKMRTKALDEDSKRSLQLENKSLSAIIRYDPLSYSTNSTDNVYLSTSKSKLNVLNKRDKPNLPNIKNDNSASNKSESRNDFSVSENQLDNQLVRTVVENTNKNITRASTSPSKLNRSLDKHIISKSIGKQLALDDQRIVEHVTDLLRQSGFNNSAENEGEIINENKIKELQNIRKEIMTLLAEQVIRPTVKSQPMLAHRKALQLKLFPREVFLKPLNK